MIDYLPGWQEAFLWVVIVAFIVAFILGFALGANDCANSYGPSVGSGVVKLWQAYLLATIFEILGAALLGYKVTDTLRKSIVNVHIYDVDICHNTSLNDSNLEHHTSIPNNVNLNQINSTIVDDVECYPQTEASFLVGALGILGGSAIWLLIATALKLPVSTTHSAVGATVGFSLVIKGAIGIHWMTVVKIVASWLLSPILAGIFAVSFYLVVKICALNRKDPLESSLKLLPWMFWFTITVNTFSVVYKGSKYLSFDKLSWWVVLLISFGLGILVAVAVRFMAIDKIRELALGGSSSSIESDGGQDNAYMGSSLYSVNKQEIASTKSDISTKPLTLPIASGTTIDDKMVDVIDKNLSASPMLDGNVKDVELGKVDDDDDESSCCGQLNSMLFGRQGEPVIASRVYASLQILSSVFLSFSHGSNDTANAVGPLVALWVTYKSGYALSDSKADDLAVQGLIGFGAVAMIIGLWCFGHKVIETVGTSITLITPASGFCMQIGTAFTVLFCSKVGIPVSTTHCLVGAVVAVGWFRSRTGVSWKIFGGIGCAWLVTLPAAGGLAALLTYLLLFAL